MKLFIWNNPYQVDYGGSYALAVAESEEDARAAIIAQGATGVSAYGIYQPLTPRPNFRELNGPPTRVLDLPCADIYEWSE